MGNIDEQEIRVRYELMYPHLNERGRRLFAANEVIALGRGGLAAVYRATGLARSTILRGLDELDDEEVLDPNLIRRPGGGRREVAKTNFEAVQCLRRLVEPSELGDPMRPLLWTSKSLEKLAAALEEAGHKVSTHTVRKMLTELGFSRQPNRKTLEGKQHPDRDAQFEHINAAAVSFQERNLPIISVDTKKKELIGNFKNAGTDYRRSRCPNEVLTHDFIDREKGKAVPYGIYDIGANEGWVSVGVDHDTAEFAVATISRWWRDVGKPRYTQAQQIMITADAGGSNGYRLRLWKVQLQALADEFGIAVTVCHFPPGTSKWNKVEHRLFSQITQNWRGTPLTSRAVIVDLIGKTRTKTGLTVKCVLDESKYEPGRKVSEGEMKSLNIKRSDFHSEWNYTIFPRNATNP
jgi:transposase